MKKIDYRHFISGLVIFGSLFALVFRHFDCIRRAGQAFVNFGFSIYRYFMYCFLLDYEEIPIKVNEFQKIDIVKYLGFSLEELQLKIQLFFDAFFDLDNLYTYFVESLPKMLLILNICLMLFLALFIAVELLKDYFFSPVQKHGQDSKPLLWYKKHVVPVIFLIKNWVLQFFDFLMENRLWIFFFCAIWFVNLNLLGILVDFLAFLLYFTTSFAFADLISIHIPKLLIDLLMMAYAVPGPVAVLAFLVILDIVRRNIGYKRLNMLESENRDFIRSLPICTFLNGPMGASKTLTMTDFALSLEAMFRDKALELMLEIDLEFPDFPWIRLELEIAKKIRNKEICNLATVRDFIQKRKKLVLKSHLKRSQRLMWGYDVLKYPTEYNNGLTMVSIWSDLEDYACLFFIYAVESSLLISNYSVRLDSVLMQDGNFPLWDSDFFHRDPREISHISRFSHILDFDTMRMSRQVVKDNPFNGSLEFGVVLVTEIDKERGNKLKNEGVKASNDETNQKNDNFNYSLKMGRHPATIRHFSFVRFLVDAQRPESWEADGRELSTELWVSDKTVERLAMPFFIFGDLTYDCMNSRFQSWYPEYRFNCGDNKLIVRACHLLNSYIAHHHQRVHNVFGYKEAVLKLEDSKHPEENKDIPYYLLFKKIYSKRYATDCHREFYAKKALQSGKGIYDYPSYRSVHASFDELHQQHSYFVASMEVLGKEKESGPANGK